MNDNTIIWIIVAVVVVIALIAAALLIRKASAAKARRREEEQRQRAGELRQEAKQTAVEARRTEAGAMTARADADQARLEAERLEEHASGLEHEAGRAKSQVRENLAEADRLDPAVNTDGDRHDRGNHAGSTHDGRHDADHSAHDDRGTTAAGTHDRADHQDDHVGEAPGRQSARDQHPDTSDRFQAPAAGSATAGVVDEPGTTRTDDPSAERVGTYETGAPGQPVPEAGDGTHQAATGDPLLDDGRGRTDEADPFAPRSTTDDQGLVDPDRYVTEQDVDPGNDGRHAR